MSFEQSNVIHVDFSPQVLNDLAMWVKQMGVERVRQGMLAAGDHPSYVKAILKKILTERGW